MPPERAPHAAFVPAGPGVDISVIVVNYNTAHLLERCIGNLRRAANGLAVQLLVVDNASRDGSIALIRSRFQDATLIENHANVGFGRANNQALECSTGRHVLLLNADAYVVPDTLHLCLQHMDTHPDCGVLGVRSVDEAGNDIFSGRAFPTPWKTFQLQTGLFSSARRQVTPVPQARTGAIQCDWVVGCCYMVRRSVVERIGLFDPRYFLYFEEIDHCKAVREAGWSVQCLLDTSVVHVGGGAAETEGELGTGRQISALQTESSLLYFRKHGGLAGVLTAAALALATDAVLAIKWLLKRRQISGVGVYGQRAALLFRLLVRTRVGAAPTR